MFLGLHCVAFWVKVYIFFIIACFYWFILVNLVTVVIIGELCFKWSITCYSRGLSLLVHQFVA